MKISLVGYMGSGKTTIGKDLSEKLHLNFKDLDLLIEESTQKSISALFKELGEIKFRKLERKILLSQLESDSDFVLALGGGTPVYYDNMKQINDYTTCVYLRANPKFLAERLIHEKPIRPLIAHLADEDLREFVAKHLFERRNFYEEANYVIDIHLKSPQEITNEIMHLPAFHQK